MRIIRNLGLSVSALLALGLVFAATPAFARTNSPATTPHPYAQMHKQKAQTFVGTIEKSKTGAYVLNVGGMTYRLSDATNAASYVGKQVRVTGTINFKTDTIQVSSIKPAA